MQVEPSIEELFDVPGDDDAMSVGFLGSLQPSAGDEVSRLMLQELGSVGRGYKRERRKVFRNIVSKVYSPPRVTAEIIRQRNREVLPGFAYDFTTLDEDDGQPWDFSIQSKREKALKKVQTQQPFMLIGSPDVHSLLCLAALEPGQEQGQGCNAKGLPQSSRACEFCRQAIS